MNLVGKLLIGGAASLLAANSAMAADVVVPVVVAPVVVTPVVPTISFAGAYMGTHIAVNFPFSFVYGVQFGYNFVRGNFLFGVEVETSHPSIAGPVVDATLSGRAGVVVADRAVIYGHAGIGTRIVVPSYSFGAGVEVAITPTMSLFAEYTRYRAMGGGFFAQQLTAGINYRPGGAGAYASTPGDWSGLYMGAAGGFTFGGIPLGNAGVQAGYNFDFGRFVAGMEVETAYWFTGSSLISAALNGRAGVDLGRVLVYGEVGIGSTFAFVPTLSLGGGAEFALNDRISVFGEANFNRVLGGGSLGTTVQGGINFRFGR